MNIVILLAPMSLGLGLIGLVAFWWTLKAGMYEDPVGDASRVLLDDADDRPL
mgnify:CR=1 FL=1